MGPILKAPLRRNLKRATNPIPLPKIGGPKVKNSYSPSFLGNPFKEYLYSQREHEVLITNLYPIKPSNWEFF